MTVRPVSAPVAPVCLMKSLRLHGEEGRVFFMEIDSTSAAQRLSLINDGCFRVIPGAGNCFAVYADTRFFMVDRQPFGAIRLKL